MDSVEIPREVLELLREIARRKGKTVIELIIDGVANLIDQSTRIELYSKLHEKLLSEARDLRVKGEILQASEKYWGAVTALLDAIGVLEGLPHYTHRDLKEITIHLSEREKDPEYSRLFSSVETLHANYYHNFLREKTFEAHIEDAEKLVAKLKSYLSRKTT